MNIPAQINELRALLRQRRKPLPTASRRVYENDKLLALIIAFLTLDFEDTDRNHRTCGPLARSSKRLWEFATAEAYHQVCWDSVTGLEGLYKPGLDPSQRRKAVREIIVGRNSPGSVFAPHQLLAAKRTCPNVRLIRTDRPGRDCVEARFEEGGQPSLTWSHRVTAQKTGRVVGSKWEPPNWTGWDMTTSLELEFAKLAVGTNPQSQHAAFLNWYEDASNDHPLFNSIDFGPHVVTLREIGHLLEAMDSRRRQEGLSSHATSLRSIEAKIRGFTLADFEHFISRWGVEESVLESLEMHPAMTDQLQTMPINEFSILLANISRRFPRLQRFIGINLSCSSENDIRELFGVIIRPVFQARLSAMSMHLTIAQGIANSRLFFALARFLMLYCTLIPSIEIFASSSSSRSMSPDKTLSHLVDALQQLPEVTKAYIRQTDFSDHSIGTLEDVYRLFAAAGIKAPRPIILASPTRVGWRQLPKSSERSRGDTVEKDFELQARLGPADSLHGRYGAAKDQSGEEKIRENEQDDQSGDGDRKAETLGRETDRENVDMEASHRRVSSSPSSRHSKRRRLSSSTSYESVRPTLFNLEQEQTHTDPRPDKRDEMIASLTEDNKELRSQIELLQSMIGKYEMEKQILNARG